MFNATTTNKWRKLTAALQNSDTWPTDKENDDGKMLANSWIVALLNLQAMDYVHST